VERNETCTRVSGAHAGELRDGNTNVRERDRIIGAGRAMHDVLSHSFCFTDSCDAKFSVCRVK
jgi:hypothetical protein